MSKNNQAIATYVLIKSIGVLQWRWPVPPQARLLFGAMPKSKYQKENTLNIST
jgi:hypothetical protein